MPGSSSARATASASANSIFSRKCSKRVNEAWADGMPGALARMRRRASAAACRAKSAESCRRADACFSRSASTWRRRSLVRGPRLRPILDRAIARTVHAQVCGPTLVVPTHHCLLRQPSRPCRPIGRLIIVPLLLSGQQPLRGDRTGHRGRYGRNRMLHVAKRLPQHLFRMLELLEQIVEAGGNHVAGALEDTHVATAPVLCQSEMVECVVPVIGKRRLDVPRNIFNCLQSSSSLSADCRISILRRQRRRCPRRPPRFAQPIPPREKPERR